MRPDHGHQPAAPKTQTSAGAWTDAEGNSTQHATYYLARALQALSIERDHGALELLPRGGSVICG